MPRKEAGQVRQTLDLRPIAPAVTRTYNRGGIPDWADQQEKIMGTEIEARYVVPDTLLFTRLLHISNLGPYALQPCDIITLTDHYLDTAHKRLTAQNWSCRLRQQMGQWIATLKGPKETQGAITSRTEMETPLPDGLMDPTFWDDRDMREQALALTGGEPLETQVLISQKRHRYAVTLDQRLIAELSLDIVDTCQTSVRHRTLMLECELHDDGVFEDLVVLDHILREEFALIPEIRSKLARALELFPVTDGAQASNGGPGLLVDDTIARATAKTLRFHLTRMLAHESGTRSGENSEELHDMRVAIRRMRSALRLFGPYLARSDIAQVNDHLRNCAHYLGHVRDLDVAIATTDNYTSTFSDQQARSLLPLQQLWEKRRVTARQALLTYMDSDQYRACVNSIRQLISDLYTYHQNLNTPSSLKTLLPEILAVHWAYVWAFAPFVDTARIETLHMLRIECKRLRYALEFVEEVIPRYLVGIIPTITAVQTHLGDMHDADIQANMLGQIMAAQEASETQGSIDDYRQTCVRRREQLLADFPAAWNTQMMRVKKRLGHFTGA